MEQYLQDNLVDVEVKVKEPLGVRTYKFLSSPDTIEDSVGTFLRARLGKTYPLISLNVGVD